ncbi:unnamed protein product [Orchesella dallaii]|uniref:UmuC domain-containing protein n=1 Tax=Orchesella dallaii TaxID=48710 RepID=A0ABP1QLB4_9HEXA
MKYKNNNYSGTSASETEDDDLDAIDDEYHEEYSPQSEAVIILLDVDSFEVQVHGLDQNISPEVLRNEPFVVANEFGVLTAVNYPAKKAGIKRTKEFNARNVRETCPVVRILEIPDHYGKPSSLIAKEKSDDIFECLKKSAIQVCKGGPPIVEKASKDEFFIDVTNEVYYRVHQCGEQVPNRSIVNRMKDKTHNETPSHRATGEKFSYRTSQVLTDPTIIQKRHETEALLVHGAAIAYQIMSDIEKITKFVCSSGVSGNKLLAKIACGLHKPDSITILPHASLPRVSKTQIKIEDIPGLAGKQGEDIKQRFKISTMLQLSYVDRVKLQKWFGSENGLKFHQLAIGVDNTKVVEKNRNLTKSMTCGITFSHKTRRMFNALDFQNHLRNRFLEMRDHVLYEVRRHGRCRFPRTFKLEVKTRKRDLQSAFGSTIDPSNHFDGNDDSNVDPRLREYWGVLNQKFIDLLCRDCKIPIFDSDPKKSEVAVRKVSAINLIANFDID